MEENNTTTTQSNSGNSNSMSLIVGAVVLAGLLGYVIFSSRDMGKDENTATETSPIVEESTENTDESENLQNDTTQVVQDATDEENVIDKNTKTIAIEAGSFYFNPSSIIVKKGDTVRIELTALDMMHDFSIDELEVKIPVTQSGSTNSVEFVVNEAGSYEFYCSVGQHRQQGQIGTLIVQE